MSWARANMSAHLISEELNSVHRERVSLGLYHNRPNPEIGTMTEETTT